VPVWSFRRRSWAQLCVNCYGCRSRTGLPTGNAEVFRIARMRPSTPPAADVGPDESGWEAYGPYPEAGSRPESVFSRRDIRGREVPVQNIHPVRTLARHGGGSPLAQADAMAGRHAAGHRARHREIRERTRLELPRDSATIGRVERLNRTAWYARTIPPCCAQPARRAIPRQAVRARTGSASCRRNRNARGARARPPGTTAQPLPALSGFRDLRRADSRPRRPKRRPFRDP